MPRRRRERREARLGTLLCTVCGRGIRQTTELIIHDGQPTHGKCYDKLMRKKRPSS